MHFIRAAGVREISNTSTHTTRSDAILNDLLARTSRTFAIAIPCLPLPACREVTVAYLLLRIADTIEDADYLDRTEKLVALERFDTLLQSESEVASTMATLNLPRCPSDNEHYRELIEQLEAVFDAVRQLSQEARSAIVRGTRISVSGMKRFVAAGTPDGNVHIQSLDELRDYCYFVAGVVGEMLSQIFLLGASWLRPMQPELEANARWFGEGLQLVNILKDAADDQRDGRVFIPPDVPRQWLFDLAREDLRRAEDYVLALKKVEAPSGYITFTELPLRLAWRTLECVEASGSGSKVPRHEVTAILTQTLAGQSIRDDGPARGPSTGDLVNPRRKLGSTYQPEA